MAERVLGCAVGNELGLDLDMPRGLVTGRDKSSRHKNFFSSDYLEGWKVLLVSFTNSISHNPAEKGRNTLEDVKNNLLGAQLTKRLATR